MTKPRDNWDADDWADFNDGWHEASGVGFTSKRDPDRIAKTFFDPGRGLRGAAVAGGFGRDYLAAGRAAREALAAGPAQAGDVASL